MTEGRTSKKGKIAEYLEESFWPVLSQVKARRTEQLDHFLSQERSTEEKLERVTKALVAAIDQLAYKQASEIHAASILDPTGLGKGMRKDARDHAALKVLGPDHGFAIYAPVPLYDRAAQLFVELILTGEEISGPVPLNRPLLEPMDPMRALKIVTERFGYKNLASAATAVRKSYAEAVRIGLEEGKSADMAKVVLKQVPDNRTIEMLPSELSLRKVSSGS